jgi:hypothetical protein
MGRIRRTATVIASAILVGACAPGSPDATRADIHPAGPRELDAVAIAYRAGAATDGDQKTFAYAASDSVALAADMATMVETVEQMHSAAADEDLAALRAGAGTLRAQAEALENNAGAAALRLGPLSPQSTTLKDARADGVSAFTLTAEYAGVATDLAGSASAADLDVLAAVTEEVTAATKMAGAVTASYDALARGLESWASAHPRGAAAARVLYGG